jgi:hypothetical protein
MTSIQPDNNDVIFMLPKAVTSMGEALIPVAKNLRRVLAFDGRSSGPEFEVIDGLKHHMGVISNALTHLQSRLDDLMANVIKDESAGMGEAYRAAGRLEQVVSEFVDGYLLVQSSRARPETRQARELLLDVYRHHLREICDWLEELAHVIANPRAAMEKRGIPFTNKVELTVALNLTIPPEMAMLEKLSEELQVEPEPEIPPPHRFHSQVDNSPGILGTIGALAFGVGITKAILGRHRG